MKKVFIVASLCLTLLAGVWVLKLQAAEKAVVDAIKKLAADVAAGKDAKTVMASGEKIAKGAAEEDVFLVMELFAKRKASGKGGLGIGAKPGAITPDGIEAKLINMGRRVTTSDMKNAKELKEMADITAAGGATTYHLAPSKVKKNAAKLAKWQKAAKDMYEQGIALSKARKAEDKVAAKAAAKKLNLACVSCHNDFR